MGNVRPRAGGRGGGADGANVLTARREIIIRAVAGNAVLDDDVVRIAAATHADSPARDAGADGRDMIVFNPIVTVINVNARIVYGIGRIISNAGVADDLAAGPPPIHKNAASVVVRNDAAGDITGFRASNALLVVLHRATRHGARTRSNATLDVIVSRAAGDNPISVAINAIALFITVVVTVAIAHHAVDDKDAILATCGNIQVLNNDINRKQGQLIEDV